MCSSDLLPAIPTYRMCACMSSLYIHAPLSFADPHPPPLLSAPALAPTSGLAPCEKSVVDFEKSVLHVGMCYRTRVLVVGALASVPSSASVCQRVRLKR